MYKIDEVVNLTGIRAYVLRYWELEFEELRPIKDSEGIKLYSEQDIETITEIKKLLFENHFSVERAKKEIKNDKPKGRNLKTVDADKIISIKDKLNALINQIDEFERSI